jgi:hypothetical protein
VTQQPRQPGADLIGDIQRWLVRSGARGVSRGVGGQIRSALGRSEGSGDVWERATRLPQDEAPECAWCPVCRAARRLNESGPGLSSQMAAATDAFATVAQDAMSVFEAALAAARPAAKDEAARPAAKDEAKDKSESSASWVPGAASPAPARGVWEEAASPAAPEGPLSEPDDRG